MASPARALDTAEHGALPANERLTRGTILTYCTPSFGTGLMMILFLLYLMKFSTDVLLIAPGVMGVILGASRVWDAVSDPLAGYLSDRTRARRGRRRSWMFVAAIPIGVSVVMLWSPPSAFEGAMLVAWMAVAYFFYETATTAFLVPYAALGMELTSDYHERTRLFGYKHVIQGAGAVCGLGLFEILRSAEDQRLAALSISVFAGTAMTCTILWAATRLRERAEFQARGRPGFLKSFADVFRNPHSRLLLFVYGVEHFGLASISLLAVYVMEYVLKLPEMTVFFLLVAFVPMYLSTPLWIRVARRFGKKRAWLASMSGAAVGFFGLFFLGEGRVVLMYMVAALVGTAMGGGSVLGPSVQADVVDYDEYLTGERKEGSYLAVWNLIRKAAGGLTALVAGLVLQWVGFEPNVEQSAQTKDAMLALFALLPGSCYVMGALLFSRFSLNEREHAEIRGVLEERRAAASPQ
jgi:GPH family glycoside/pentoside/hexuronide:cation symporter